MRLILCCLLLSLTGCKTPARQWIYQLQNLDSFVQTHHQRTNTIFVIDYSKDGTDTKKFTLQEIAKLKNSGANLVLSYFSIGEAEDFRYYFKKLPKELLTKANPTFPDNIYVKYWDKRWQSILADNPDSYLNRILNAGFDGVYLDRVDAFWDFPKRTTAASEMVDWVAKISTLAKAQNPDFKIFIQNGACIIKRDELQQPTEKAYTDKVNLLFNSIDGIGLESLFFMGSKWDDNNRLEQPERVECVKQYAKHDKTLIAVEYVRDRKKQAQAKKLFNANSLTGLITDRHLKGEFFIQAP